MKTISIILLLFSHNPVLAESFKIFPEGQYKALNEKCEDRSLRYINDENLDILVFGQDVSIEISGPMQSTEKVPDGCSYKFEYVRNANSVQRKEVRTSCPNKNEEGSLSVELEKSKDGNIQMTKRSIASDGKVQEEKCSFKKQ